jgi:hypothetical protein
MTKLHKQEIAQKWISFAKSMRQSEQPNLSITEWEYEWFGRVMEMIKGNSEWPTPCGTECRRYPRAFFRILDGGIDYAKDFLIKWVTVNQGEYYMMNMAGKDADYDLLGYDIRELLRTTEWKKYQKIMWGDDWEKKQSLLSINELEKTPKNNS